MSYKVDYSAMQELMGAYNGAVEKWNSGISSVMQKELAIEESANISGNRASNMKQYLATAYSCINDSLLMLLSLFIQSYILYTEDYYQQIDSDGDTQIDSEELSMLRANLQEKRGLFRQIALNAEKTVEKVSDIVLLPNIDICESDAKFGNLLSSLDDLDTAINALESAHESTDFTEIDEIISKLDAYLLELIGQSKEFKVGFTTESFLALASVPALLTAMHDAYDQLSAQKSDVEDALANIEKRLEQEQQEMEKRKKIADWGKVGLTAVVGLASAAIMVVASPAGAIVIGSISAATSAIIDAASDEYVENGLNLGEWDVDRIKIHGCIGAVTGMVGSCFPNVGPCAKAGVNALSSAFEGTASASYDQLAANGRITDIGQIASDALIKGSSSFVGSLAGSAVSENMRDAVKRNSTIKDLSEHVVGGAKHFGAVSLVEGASELTSGVVKRFSSTAVQETGGFAVSLADGKSITEAYNEHSIVSKSFKSAIDIKSIVSDATSAVTSAVTDDPLMASEKKLAARKDDYYQFGDSPDLNGKEDAWKDWNSEEYDRMMEKLAEMDARGDDARNYELFGDPRSFAAQRSSAVDKAWEQEKRLVMQGRGTRDWTIPQQEELLRTGRVSGFDGSHMLDASSNPSVANDPNNIQFLTYEEHIYGAHGGNTHNPTTGRYDTLTGETSSINPRQIPHRETVSFELSQKFDYSQMNLADQLGSDFGYSRGKK